MKKNYTIVIILFLSITLSSFMIKGKKDNLPKVFKDLKAVTHIPNGRLNGKNISSFYIFTYEVTNLDYKEFIQWNKNNSKTVDIEALIVDTSLWRQVSIVGNDFYSKNYHKWSNYPVVNISKEAAIKYCEWLSKMWNDKQKEYEVIFKLPTKDEWEYAASGGLKKVIYPWENPYVKNAKGRYLAQFKAFGLKMGPMEVGSFAPNDYGVYDLSGNVAEMVSENIVKGGSWNSLAKEITIKSEGKYEKSPYVGFRPIMVIYRR